MSAFKKEIRRTKGHELLWAYAKKGDIKPGDEIDGTDMYRAVGNALCELGECSLKNHPPEAMLRLIDTLATVTHMLHTETNLLRRDHGLPELTAAIIAAREKKL